MQDRAEQSNQERNRREKASRRRKLQRNRRIAIFVVIIALLAAMVGVSLYHIMTLRAEQAKLKAENKTLTEEKKDLEKELKKVNDPEYIEKLARERLHMIKKGETLYVFPDDSEGDGANADGAGSDEQP